MSQPAWPVLIEQCFASTTFMALGTHGPEGLWVNPVYFAWDKGRSLYFISQLDCRHMRNLGSAGPVSCAIYPTNQTGDVFGAYLKGQAVLLSKDGPEKDRAGEVYYGRIYPNANLAEVRKEDPYSSDPTWHLVKVAIDQLWYFDTRYFGETRVEVPLEEIC